MSAGTPAGHDDPALESVRAALEAAGLTSRIVVFDTELPTAAVAAAQLGCQVGAIANSLVFRADSEPVLVLASGAHRVDVARAGALFGVERLRRADPQLVLAATGQEVGGCAPVGHPTPLRTVIDADLAGYDRLWAGAGIKPAMFWCTFEELVALTCATVAEVSAREG